LRTEGRVALTRFDEGHCHKWALLLKERKRKIEKASEAEVGCVVFNLKNVMDYTKRTKGGSNGLLC